MPSDPTYTYPPLHHHTSHPLSPSQAAGPLASYLEKSLSRPYLHPDAWLSLEGVRHGPKSGPQGSWALHHLRRIEAGMRGEQLAVESMEMLVERFGEEVVGDATGIRAFRREREEETEEGAVEEEEVEVVREKPKKTKVKESKPESQMTKAEKKKAKRAAERAEKQKAREAGEEVPSFRKRKASVSSSASSHQEHSTNINDPTLYESARSHSLSQKPLLEDVGDRDPAGVDREEAVEAPVVVEHDKEGEVVVPKKRKAGPEEKEARRLAKKAKKAEAEGDVEMVDAEEGGTQGHQVEEEGSSKKEKLTRKQKRAAAEAEAANGASKETNGAPATKKPEKDLAAKKARKAKAKEKAKEKAGGSSS